MERHKQKFIKVNAPVDSKIADLVGSLSIFPQLRTIESCQGGPGQSAWVCFSYGENQWQELARFALDYLGPQLAAAIGDRANLYVRVTESGQVLGELTVRPGALQMTTNAIKRLAKNFKS